MKGYIVFYNGYYIDRDNGFIYDNNRDRVHSKTKNTHIKGIKLNPTQRCYISARE